MPNGVSCAYFAIKNHEKAKNENSIFREGIAGIQTVRTLNAATEAIAQLPSFRVLGLGRGSSGITIQTGEAIGTVATKTFTPLQNFLRRATNFLRPLVYPLIILSGISKTVKSDDKLKTGTSQAAAIGTMYAFENIAERGLNILSERVRPFCESHKWAKPIFAVARGMAFVAASIGGYELGSKSVEYIIDRVRPKSGKDISNNQKLQNIVSSPVSQTDDTSPFTEMML